MGTEKLSRILAPPKHPSERGDPDRWQSVERELALVLPRDYIEFINAYGSGRIAGFIWIFNPFSANPNLNLLEQARSRVDAHRSFRTSFPDAVPYPLYPEPGGLLPCGATDNGDVLFWLTEGEPDSWRIVVAASRAEEHLQFDLSLTRFLAEILSRKRSCGIFPDGFPSGPVDFVPIPTA